LLAELLSKVSSARVLVVGDVMLDRYWYGDVDRISPEAPVPVVSVAREDERLGGAANVARNISALGGQSGLLAISGDDQGADKLEALGKNAGIDVNLYRDRSVNTTIKLRVVSQNQQLIRVDFDSPVSKEARIQLLHTFGEILPNYDLVVISDYAKGGLGHIREIIHLAKKNNVQVLIDPKGDDYHGYKGATLITPNRKEFEQVVGPFVDDTDLEQRALELINELELEAILITRSEEGMTLVEANGNSTHMPAQALEVFDVTGAGDTVIACIGLAYAAGASTEDALRLANVAAGIVVGKVGSEVATPHEILSSFEGKD
jgi:rfaE bifunctional protein kinase chain/domain